MTPDPRLPALRALTSTTSPNGATERLAVPRKQNVKWMLTYCRKYIPGFADMHDRAKASRSGVMPIGGKAKPK